MGMMIMNVRVVYDWDIEKRAESPQTNGTSCTENGIEDDSRKMYEIHRTYPWRNNLFTEICC